jgi:hypothetical protein
MKAQKNVLDLFRPSVRRLADDGVIARVPKFPSIQVPEVEVQVIDPETQDRVLQAIAWGAARGVPGLGARGAPALRGARDDLDDYDPGERTLRVNKPSRARGSTRAWPTRRTGRRA